jgi:hypothetical protein
MDVAIEFHGFWNLPSAIKIAAPLKIYEPMWLEEILPQDNLGGLRRIGTRDRPAPVPQRAADDTLGISRAFRESRSSNHHAGCLLARRDFGGQEDCQHGGNSLAPDCAAQLWWPYPAFCFCACGRQRDQPLHCGNGAATVSRGVRWVDNYHACAKVG